MVAGIIADVGLKHAGYNMVTASVI